MRSEAAERADFSAIRYAQCWEDADILLDALNIQPGSSCLSIASAGDNALAMLTRDPTSVVAIDLSPAQLALLELRVAAFRELEHAEILKLIGSVPGRGRKGLYQRCRVHLSQSAREFWDHRTLAIEDGIGSAGKFENYFRLFRTRVLPCIHSAAHVQKLLSPTTRDCRIEFYESEWNNLRWRLLFRLFFSQTAMGRLGRDPEFFRYVNGNVAQRILSRTEYALTELDPSTNPYVRWILTGAHTKDVLPCYLRPDNVETIRKRLDRLSWRCSSLEDLLSGSDTLYDAFNLSDIFEYMSEERYEGLLRLIIRAARPSARLAYWNMLAPRSRPDSLANSLRSLEELSKQLFARDQAFFYSAFVVEEVA
jgi:S-adenosylmethionine-diacylglycerol 3-amino-3-carboxypropyl transferase